MRYAIAMIGGMLALASCRGFAGGSAGGSATGADLGIRDGSANVIERRYQKPLDQVWNAIVQSLEDSNLMVENAQSDAFGGWLNARRADESRIAIEVKSISNTMTLVAVHSGEDRIVANRIHALIAEKLGLAPATGTGTGAQGGVPSPGTRPE